MRKQVVILIKHKDIIPPDFHVDAMRIMDKLASDWEEITCTPLVTDSVPGEYLMPLWVFSRPIGGIHSAFKIGCPFHILEQYVTSGGDPHLQNLHGLLLGGGAFHPGDRMATKMARQRIERERELYDKS